MSTAHNASPQQAPQAAPELPAGWRYTDDVEREDVRRVARRRRALYVVLGVTVVLVVVASLFVNAQLHYSRGAAALQRGEYAQAVSELSGAKILLFSYRDAWVLTDQAQRAMVIKTADAEQAQAMLESVSAALNQAAASLKDGSLPAVIEALQSVGAGDLRAVIARDAAVGKVGAALAADLTAEGKAALTGLEWGRAARSSQALLILQPGSAAAADLAEKAAAGQKLSAQLAQARAAARGGEWRKALRLALAVLAAHEGFPGAQFVVADARQALKPKPKPAPTVAQPATTPATTTTTTGSTSGGSSGGSSGPAPP